MRVLQNTFGIVIVIEQILVHRPNILLFEITVRLHLTEDLY